MPGRFVEINSRVRGLIEAGDLEGARRLLRDAFAGADADTLGGSGVDGAAPDLIEAAVWYARILAALNEPQAARGWAAFAHAATRDRYGPDGKQTLATAATLAAALHRVGSDARAAHLYRDLVARLSKLYGPDSPNALAARADLATVLHARGECTEARALLERAWTAHRTAHGDGHPAGIKMLALLGGMERDCGHLVDAHEHLAHARALCRVHLPPGHPLTGQVATLADAAANRDHRCRNAPVIPRQAGPVDTGTPPGEPWWPPEQVLPVTAGPPPLTAQPRHVDAEPRAPITAAGGTPSVPRARRPRRPGVRLGLAATALGVLAVTATGSSAARRAEAPDAAGPPIGAAPPSGVTTAPVPSSSPSVPPATGPPTGVILVDRGDHAVLSWTYPAGADGQVVISGGSKDRPLQAFQRLPAGTSSFTVYGLTARDDYCFAVAVVYSTSLTARAAPLCTRRGAGR